MPTSMYRSWVDPAKPGLAHRCKVGRTGPAARIPVSPHKSPTRLLAREAFGARQTEFDSAGPAACAQGGAILAISPRGRTRILATLPTGPNPIAVIAPAGRSAAPTGLYVADTITRTIYLARAAQLAPYRGTVIIGSELSGRFWILRPHGRRFQLGELATDLPSANYNLEAAAYVPN
jgi:hypothetical protein